VLAALVAAATPSILDRIVNPDQPPRLPAVKMLAVLPFTHGNGGGEDDAAFGAGLVETVTSTLFQRAELSSWRFVSPGEIQGKNVTSADEVAELHGFSPVEHGPTPPVPRAAHLNASAARGTRESFQKWRP
jgi:hypothetical protein